MPDAWIPQGIQDWISSSTGMLSWLLGVSIAMFIGTLIAIPLIVARIPSDYFTRERPFRHRLPRIRWLVKTIKNAVGLIFILAGVVMLVLPGQGILTILIGLMWLDLPGKRAFELRLLRQPQVNRSLNWIRRRAKQPPLELP